MSHDKQIILVTGATGRQGGAVIRQLLRRGWKLRALSRQADGSAVKALVAQGIEVVRGDLEDPVSLGKCRPRRRCSAAFSASE
jgi:uncharacterized protein YbjT (DUF2867 family)